MQRSFGPRSQLLANLGFYFLAVNYRGVDGYGRNYSDAYNPSNAAQDVLAAYQWLINNPGVDQNNIFIFSMSGGTPIVLELLHLTPEHWRGVAIDKPSSIDNPSRFNAIKMPPLLLISGDQDQALPSVNKFIEWTKNNSVPARIIIYTNAAHITYDLKSRKQSQKQVADFFIESLK